MSAFSLRELAALLLAGFGAGGRRAEPASTEAGVAEVDDAIEVMAKFLLGRSLPPNAGAKIVASLRPLSSGRPGAAP
jgi:hypothetical protein